MSYPMSNIPHPDCPEDRVVGFRLKSTDQAYGQYGLSEPIFWLEKLVKDAARYQWIKEQSELSSYEDSYALPIVHAWDYKPGPELNEQFESLDAAIDSAMLKGE